MKRPIRRSHRATRPWVLLPLAWLVSATALAQDAPEPQPVPAADPAADPAAILPSDAVIEIQGLDEGRFNPTHGTVFFVLNGADFPAEAQDVAVLVNDAQIPAPRIAISRRIVSASYVMPAGLNEIILRAWDAAGQLMSADTLVWAGDRVAYIDVVDITGQPISGAVVTAQLANQRAVQASVDTPGGVARIVNLPPENIAIEARHPDGRTGSVVLAPDQDRVVLVLR